MTRAALIVGAVLAGLLLQTGPQPAAARAWTPDRTPDSAPNTDGAPALRGQMSAQGALYTTDQTPGPSGAEVDGHLSAAPRFALGTTPPPDLTGRNPSSATATDTDARRA